MKRVKATTRTIAKLKTIRSLAPIDTPLIFKRVVGRRSGEWRLNGPFHRYIAPSRIEDMPIAVMSGARRGARRQGRYAMRSILTLLLATRATVVNATARNGRPSHRQIT